MNWPLLLVVLPLAALAFTALGFAMAWWIDSTQGYHAVMMVALIPLWMLSGRDVPPTGGNRAIATLMALDPMTYAVSAVRRGFHGPALAGGLVPPRSSWTTDLAVVAGFALVSVALAVALCRRKA